MRCPKCNTEMRISHAKNVLKGETLYRRMTYACRNKTCDNYDKSIKTIDVVIPIEIEDAPTPTPKVEETTKDTVEKDTE